MARCSPFRPNVCVCVHLQDEKQRIEALGGCVIWFGTWRVNGSLSVSRAIGNHELRHILSTCSVLSRLLLYLVLYCHPSFIFPKKQTNRRLKAFTHRMHFADCRFVASCVIIILRKSDTKSINKIKVNFSELSRCKQTDHPVMMDNVDRR